MLTSRLWVARFEEIGPQRCRRGAVDVMCTRGGRGHVVMEIFGRAIRYAFIANFLLLISWPHFPFMLGFYFHNYIPITHLAWED